MGRVAGLELGGEWVRKKVLLCATFICFQGLVENLLEVGGRRGSIVSMKVMRHTGWSEESRGWWWIPVGYSWAEGDSSQRLLPWPRVLYSQDLMMPLDPTTVANCSDFPHLSNLV